MSGFNLTEKERQRIHKQHEEAAQKEKERIENLKKGLQKPNMPKKEEEKKND